MHWHKHHQSTTIQSKSALEEDTLDVFSRITPLFRSLSSCLSLSCCCAFGFLLNLCVGCVEWIIHVTCCVCACMCVWCPQKTSVRSSDITNSTNIWSNKCSCAGPLPLSRHVVSCAFRVFHFAWQRESTMKGWQRRRKKSSHCLLVLEEPKSWKMRIVLII